MVSAMLPGHLRSTQALAVGAALLLATGAARATEPRDAAAAEALFEDAKALLEQGDVTAACPKFEESYRLDPATGALIALALCHERAGKLATAWVEFIEAAGRANADRNPEREATARERADALLPRLSFLVIRVNRATAGLPGLTVLHDDVTLRPAAFGAAIPVDPGPHVVHAEAPGYAAWETTVDVGLEPQRQALDVPALEAIVAPVAPPPPPHEPPRPAPAPTKDTLELTPLRLGGVALGSAGVASLGFAAFASWRALDKKASSGDGCDATGCTQAGQNDRMAAREAAVWATAGVISGTALLGAGALLWVLGRPAERRAGAAQATLLIGPGRAEFRQAF